MAMEPYAPLSLSQRQIRLLEIEQGSFLDEICCNLTTAALTDNPHYDALSYVWGITNAEDPILVNEIPVRVTENLEAAMRHLRRLDRSIIIWIDALCINQKDTLERNQQVSLMSAIYRGAQEVLAWLGDIDAATDKVLTMMELFSDDLWLHWDPEQSPSIPKDMVSASQFLALRSLLGRPWWTRVWTVQESILPEHLIFVCGHRKIDAAIFFGFSRNFARHMASCCGDFFLSQDQSTLRDLRYQVDSLYTMQFFRERNSHFRLRNEGSPGYAHGFNFMQQMSHYRSRSCTEPKDKIYGFLSFGADDDIVRNINPDYSLSDQTVYEEVAGRMMERHGLSLLDEVLPEQALQTKASIKNIPSWVPDWTVIVPRDAVRPMFEIRQPHGSLKQYHTAGKLKSWEAASYHRPGKLAVRAAIFGAIGVLGDSCRRYGQETTMSRSEYVVTIQRWRSLAHIDDEPERPYRDSDLPEDQKGVPEIVNDPDYQYVPITVEGAFWEVLCSSLILASPDGLTIGGQAENLDHRTAREAYEKALKSRATSAQDESGQRALEFLDRIFQTLGTQRFLVSSNESALIGLAPFTARVGDRIAVFEGGAGPYIIRKDGHLEEQEWLFVGKAYVHGVMYGDVQDLASFDDIVLV